MDRVTAMNTTCCAIAGDHAAFNGGEDDVAVVLRRRWHRSWRWPPQLLLGSCALAWTWVASDSSRANVSKPLRYWCRSTA